MKMKNNVFYCLPLAFSLLISSASSAQQALPRDTGKIEWIGFEEAVRRNDLMPKKIFIDVYTDWCGWCKRMDASTFLDTSVVRQLRSDYYAVKLNAETKDTIRFRDKVFVFKPEFKANEIALALLNGKMGYPSFVLMDEEYKILQPLSGFQTTEELMPLLRFYGTNAYKSMKLDDYLRP